MAAEIVAFAWMCDVVARAQARGSGSHRRCSPSPGAFCSSSTPGRSGRRRSTSTSNPSACSSACSWRGTWPAIESSGVALERGPGARLGGRRGQLSRGRGPLGAAGRPALVAPGWMPGPARRGLDAGRRPPPCGRRRGQRRLRLPARGPRHGAGAGLVALLLALDHPAMAGRGGAGAPTCARSPASLSRPASWASPRRGRWACPPWCSSRTPCATTTNSSSRASRASPCTCSWPWDRSSSGRHGRRRGARGCGRSPWSWWHWRP